MRNEKKMGMRVRERRWRCEVEEEERT